MGGGDKTSPSAKAALLLANSALEPVPVIKAVTSAWRRGPPRARPSRGTGRPDRGRTRRKVAAAASVTAERAGTVCTA